MTPWRWQTAFRSSRLRGTVKLVAWALYSRMDTNCQCWPSTATLARDAGCSESTVQNAIRELVRAGWLKKQYRRAPEGQSTNLYTAKVPKRFQKHPDEDLTSDPFYASDGAF